MKVESNTDLRLEAGEQITLKPGVHIKNGAKFHAKIAYQECFETSGLQVQNPPQTNVEEINNADNSQQSLLVNELERETITVFPNPTNSNFTVKTNHIINTVTIYTIGGQLVDRIKILMLLGTYMSNN